MSDSSTGQILGAIVGAVVGWFVGGPGGAAQGASIGYGVGGIIDPVPLPANIGPRMQDLFITSSVIGAPIHRLYGTMRLNGNIIWSSGIEETRNSDTAQGSKGGPSQENITYTYSVNTAIGLCEGEIDAVRRIWADAQLIYDNSNTASAETLLAKIGRAHV